MLVDWPHLMGRRLPSPTMPPPGGRGKPVPPVLGVTRLPGAHTSTFPL
jgi:hypothetical protein